MAHRVSNATPEADYLLPKPIISWQQAHHQYYIMDLWQQINISYYVIDTAVLNAPPGLFEPSTFVAPSASPELYMLASDLLCQVPLP